MSVGAHASDDIHDTFISCGLPRPGRQGGPGETYSDYGTSMAHMHMSVDAHTGDQYMQM